MTNPQALAKLIDNAPELAGEVMPEGCAFGDDRVGGQFRYAITHTTPDGCLFLFPDGVDAPDWFYQAVAGKLAEWLCDRERYVQRWEDEWYLECMGVGGTKHLNSGPTYFAALVEAAIVVHSSS